MFKVHGNFIYVILYRKKFNIYLLYEQLRIHGLISTPDTWYLIKIPRFK